MHKILIVDDDPNDEEITRRVLSRTGFDLEVDAVTRGESALELLLKGDDLPSLLLLDLKMPGMSGVETLQRIRADERWKGITVIVLTNSLLESDKNASYTAGADDFLHKAFDIHQFERDIKSVLERWLKN